MKYIAAIFILWNTIYILGFAKYNLRKKNKKAAIGAVILAISVIIFPMISMLIKQ